MQKVQIGSLVYRKSYERDILFRVSDIVFNQGKKIFILKGVNVRLVADAEEDDLDIIEQEQAFGKY
jgi:spore coat assembly protein